MTKIKRNNTPGESTSRESSEYIWSMSHAPHIDEGTHVLALLPIIAFSSIVILIVRMYTYTRPMSQFFWTNQTDSTPIVDFFSYYKMMAIAVCTFIVLILLLYRVITQSLAIKHCFAYVPMIVYTFFVVLSYIFSDYKEFAWLGWNDRFEGTLSILGYMVLLFYTINAVKTERDVKIVLYPMLISSTFLSILGISQALNHDFFRTVLGQKLIVPNIITESGITTWEGIDVAAAQGLQYLDFTFKANQIYQTVYNINYVSFYLTLLIPLLGMLFIRSFSLGSEEKFYKKVGFAILFAMLIYNLIGSASSGGFLGIGIMGLMGLIILNKRLLMWIKPLLILFVITGAVAGVTYDLWVPELANAIGSSMPKSMATFDENSSSTDVPPGSIRPVIDYFITNTDSLELSLNGNPLKMQITFSDAQKLEGVVMLDEDGTALPMYETEPSSGIYFINDERFKNYITISYANDGTYYYLLASTATDQWPFCITESGVFYYNQLGRLVDLDYVPSIGFENNHAFGSGRGYIWSRTLPMLKDSIFLGKGADTYCAYFPQDDYTGKYNSSVFGNSIYTIVDKPHNMFMQTIIGTGGISFVALLAIYFIYIMQSIKLYRKIEFKNSFLIFLGAGSCFGITGFLITGLVDDSTVSVMPMFYTLLGMGIAINMIIKKQSSMEGRIYNAK